MDLHTHSKCSDGKLSVYDLVKEAREVGIRYLAVTDHNYMLPEKEFIELKENFIEMTLIPGCEIDCEYEFKSGKKVVLHVVALYPHTSLYLNVMRDMLSKYTRTNREPYIRKLLENLRELNIELDSYEQLQKKYDYLGRPVLAYELKSKGYVNSVNEAMDLYLGDFGQGLALKDLPKKNSKKARSLDEVIEVIRQSKGMAILAHLYYYKLTEEEERELLEYFSRKTGKMGGMEVNYRAYNQEQRDKLKEYSKEFDLFPSVASDYHGYYETDSLDNQFEGRRLYSALISRYFDYYEELLCF